MPPVLRSPSHAELSQPDASSLTCSDEVHSHSSQMSGTPRVINGAGLNGSSIVNQVQ